MAAAKLFLYPCFFIAGIIIDPKAAPSALADPEIPVILLLTIAIGGLLENNWKKKA